MSGAASVTRSFGSFTEAGYYSVVAKDVTNPENEIVSPPATLTVVGAGLVTPSEMFVEAGSSITFTALSNPASVSWPGGCPTATVTFSTGSISGGTLSDVSTATGSANVTFYPLPPFTGVATITFNCSSSSNSATVTVVRIDGVDVVTDLDNHTERVAGVSSK